MPICLCGQVFSEKISCSRHQSTCRVYRESLKNVAPEFIKEGYDFVQCPYCGFKGRDLTQHLTAIIPGGKHKGIAEFKSEFPGRKLVCSETDILRKKTCEKRYGDENYRNRELQIDGLRQAFSNHDLLDSIKKTKLERYGNQYYVNSEKRKRTLIERYGVDNPMKCESFKNKSKETYKKLYKENPVIRPPKIEKEILIELHHNQKKTLHEIGKIVGVTESIVSYWMHKHGVEVQKKNAIIKHKEFLSPHQIVREYLEKCREYQKELSFHEYGIKCGDKNKQRMKRLFKRGGLLQDRMEELRRVIPQTGGWDNFLKSLLYKNIKTLNGENSVLIFRKAFSRDLNSVTDLFSAVIKDMNMNNLFLWNHNYPSRGTIKKDIEKETMYVITLNENIVGAVVLNNKFSKSKNRDVKFSNKALHIHRLCTHPIFQRKNLASDILHLVEKIGFCLGFSALRAEVFPLNTSSYNLFNRLEYRTIGNIEFFNGRAAVFEKVLSTDPKIDTKNVIINKSL